MKRAVLTIPVIVLGVWGYAEFRPTISTDAAAVGTDATALEDTSRVVMRRLWKLPAGFDVRMGSVTPDGRYLPVAASGRQEQIRLLDLEARDIHEMAERLEMDSDEANRFTSKPVPSPDGEWLAYQEGYTGANLLIHRLRVARTDGSEARTLYDGSMGVLYPTGWSHDGARLAGWLYGRGNSTALALVDVQKADVHILKSLEWHRGPTNPMFSPDGRFVAYSRQPDSISNQDIFVIAADGSREAAAVEHPAQDELLGWTPGGALLFRSDRRGTGTHDFWAVPLEDGRAIGPPVLIVPDATAGRTAGFTRSGDFVYEVRVGQPASYVANLAPGGNMVQTATSTGGVARTLWSPDGEYLASTERGEKALTIRAEATDAERKVPVDVGRRISLQSWSPDGRSIIAQIYDSRGRLHFSRVDAETGALTELMRLRGGQTSYTPILAPDQSTLYFGHVPPRPGGGGPGTGSVVARDLRTGEERTLFTGPPARPFVWEAALSPDATRFGVAHGSRAFLGASNRIAVVSLDGAVRELVRAESREEFYDVRWTPDGRSVVYLKSYDTGVVELWRVAATGGRPEQIQFPDGVPPIARLGNFHPDGLRFTYTSQSVSEIWMMEDLAGAVRQALEAVAAGSTR
jgi:Tol biopolymer transport system component